MNVILYPVHLWRKFERRWTERVAQDECQRFRSVGTGCCSTCGRLAQTPAHATYVSSGDVVHHWRCSECRNSWQTSIYPVIDTESQSSQAEHLREKAGRCLTLEGHAPNELARNQSRRMGDSWRALAETQDWLDGMTPPVARPMQQERVGLISSASNAPRGHLA